MNHHLEKTGGYFIFKFLASKTPLVLDCSTAPS